VFRRAFTVAFFLAFLAAACAAVWLAPFRRRAVRPGGGRLEQLADVQSALARVNEDMLAALRRGDAHACAFGYAEDAVSMPGHGQTVRGRHALEVALGRVFERARFLEVSTATTDTRVDGTSAVEVGQYRFLVAALESGRRHTVQGRYMLMWTHADGVWKIVVDAAQPDAAE
jgi:uncharacterized protein (TIGR02246 family)